MSNTKHIHINKSTLTNVYRSIYTKYTMTKATKRQILDETSWLTVQLIFTPSLFFSVKSERNIFSFI